MGLFGALFGSDKGTATMDAADRNKKLLSDLEERGLGYLEGGTDKAADILGQAGDVYDGYATRGEQSGQLYSDALGLNGAAGNTRATDAFQTGPGYEFAMDQGLQALSRSAAAQGRLQSGQSGLDTINYAQGLANQEYGNWLDRLNGVSQQGLSAANGQATTLSELASLYPQLANSQTSLVGSVTSGKIGANNQWAKGKEANEEAESFGLGDLAGAVKLGGYAAGLF